MWPVVHGCDSWTLRIGDEEVYMLSTCEDCVRHYVYHHGLQSVHMTWYWIKLECDRLFLESAKAMEVNVFGTYQEKEVREFGEADNARNNAGSRTTHKRHGWATFFNGLDTHWTRHSCILKSESSGDSSFVV